MGHHDFVAVFLYVYIFIAANYPHSILFQVCADNTEFFAHFLKISPPERLVWAPRGISQSRIVNLRGQRGEADSSLAVNVDDSRR